MVRGAELLQLPNPKGLYFLSMGKDLVGCLRGKVCVESLACRLKLLHSNQANPELLGH